jgi:hypothetical protein
MSKRQEAKRSDSRKKPAAQRERQTQRAAQSTTAAKSTTGSRQKRPTARSPQLIPAKPATQPATSRPAQTRRTTAPKATRAQRASVVAAAATLSVEATEPTVEVAQVAVEPQPAPVQMQMPEIPEVPQPPDAPEIPEMPEQPDIPEIPAVPDAPETPEIPEVPETPETPEIPETPETPEVPEVPETPIPPTKPEEPVEPEEPAEPTEPTEPETPDSPAVEVPDGPGDGNTRTNDAEPSIVPVATERRMPTLAAMARPLREARTEEAQAASGLGSGPASEAPAASEDASADLGAGGDAIHVPLAMTAALLTEQPAASTARSQNGRQGAKKQSETAAKSPPNPTSIVTRPVTSRHNPRRKVPRPPGLIWEDDPHLPGLPWPARRLHGGRPQALPPADLVAPVVVAHALFAAVLALVGALVALSNSTNLAAWTLAGAILAGVGGGVAYVFGEVDAVRRFSPHVLVVSQLGLLTWAMVILGPRASLLALIPALVEITLLMGGTLLASAYVLGALLLYACFAGLSISIALTPAGMLSTNEYVMLDVVCVVVGLLAALWLLLAIQSGRARAQAIARARRHEADVLRNLVTQFRQEAQDDTGKLESALIQALKGHGIGPIPTEGAYRLLAETIMDTAARLETLQRDREERLRLEGSLRVLIRAVEREWLGVEPEWPSHTGTAIDDLVALLKTPRLTLSYRDDADSPSITPRLIPIPTLAVERDTPSPLPISRPLSSASWMPTRRRQRRAELYPVPSADDDCANADLDDME